MEVRGRVDSDPMKFVDNQMDMEKSPLTALRRKAQSIAGVHNLNQFTSSLEIEKMSHACLVDYLYPISVFMSMA